MSGTLPTLEPGVLQISLRWHCPRRVCTPKKWSSSISPGKWALCQKKWVSPFHLVGRSFVKVLALTARCLYTHLMEFLSIPPPGVFRFEYSQQKPSLSTNYD